MNRARILMVEDRLTSFTQYVIQKNSASLVLLRFASARDALPESHLLATKNIPTFWIEDENRLPHEAERFSRWRVQENLNIAHFCNASEARQSYAQEFARLVGLEHLNSQQTVWVRDKLHMKSKFRALGLNTAAYSAATGPSDVLLFAANHGWPVVVKPRDSFATIDTFKISSSGDLAQVPWSKRSSWLVEQYIYGVEYESCSLIHDGQVISAWPSVMPARPLDIVEGAMNANISLGLVESLPLDLKALTQRIVSGMGIPRGYLHMEFFLDNERVYMSEVGVRLAGCEITANHGLAYGFDVFQATLDTYRQTRPSLNYKRRRCVGDLLLPLPDSGIVRSITALESLCTLPGVIGGKLKVHVGDSVSRVRASHTSSGYLHVEGQSSKHVVERMQGALDAFQIEVSGASSDVGQLPTA